MYWKYSENPDWVSEEASMVRLYNFEEIQNDVDRSYIGHHLYDWSKSRDVWFSSNSDVFIDFGDEFLWKMIKYGKNNLPCIKKIRKDYFIRRATENKS
ncbi:hypothetical protein [uncultured Nonlabens sp.]|uniref:hypothetical protein n=1 Tax=uncultured Nonlabens sp. TaxID=859306 RepID=UPI002634C3CD|nr:hypothetical protein [uncultured Nonlabens sp.]